MTTDVRWKQRFSSFNKALEQLKKAVAIEAPNDVEKQGIIKCFEYTFELGWKTLQDLLKEKGYSDVVGPKPVIRQAFKDGYISDGEGWGEMHKARNLTSHTYDEETANDIVEKITAVYYFLLLKLKKHLDEQGR
jgi:nucleotidyltransferase substrate binding protein (TIGR01987 family)